MTYQTRCPAPHGDRASPGPIAPHKRLTDGSRDGIEADEIVWSKLQEPLYARIVFRPWEAGPGSYPPGDWGEFVGQRRQTHCSHGSSGAKNNGVIVHQPSKCAGFSLVAALGAPGSEATPQGADDAITRATDSGVLPSFLLARGTSVQFKTPSQYSFGKGTVFCSQLAIDTGPRQRETGGVDQGLQAALLVPQDA